MIDDDWSDKLGFCVDLKAGYIEFDCGWRTPIVDMIDEDGDFTLDKNEAVTIIAKMPGMLIWVIQLDRCENDPILIH